MQPRRLTPLLVLPDIEPQLAVYGGLGFEVIDSGTPGIVSLRAGNSFLILATTVAMLEMFRRETVEALQGQTVPYVHLASLHDGLCNLLPKASIVDVAGPPAYRPHAVVNVAGALMILAEREPSPRWRDVNMVAPSGRHLH